MRLPAPLKFWLLLPAYAVNGIEVAIGIGCIQLAALGLAGAHAAALVVSGAACASIADQPNTAPRTWHRVSAAALLSAGAALIVDLLRPHPLALGAAIAIVAFAAMMTLAWGLRAGAVSFTPVLSMVFSMAVPPTGHPFEVAGWSACGGFAYLAWSLAAGAVCQRRYRTLVLVQTLQAAAQLFRSRADVQIAAAPEAGRAAPLRAWISGEAGFADRLQAARDLLFASDEGPRWRCEVGVLLRLIDMRDVLLASRLDADLLGDDATGRAVLQASALALRRVGDDLDHAARRLRDGVREIDGHSAPLGDVETPLGELPIEPGDARARLLPSLRNRLQRLAQDSHRIHLLLSGRAEPLPLTHAQLQLFVAPEGWPLRALEPHWRRDSLVLRHAIRMSLALATAYYLALLLPWGSHPYWLVLSVAVVLRGKLGETLARRNARVLGTLLGCLIVVGLARIAPASELSGVFLVALGTAHAFMMQRYWLTATAASVMALLQSHLVDPSHGFAIAERVADTLLGALLAWCFSYVLPSWERRSGPEAIGRVLRDLRAYAANSLQMASADPVAERLARRKAYDALTALSAALQRSTAEPKGVRLPTLPIAQLLDHSERLMAHLSLVRLTLARLKNADAPLPQLGPMLDEAASVLRARLDLGQPTASSQTADAIDTDDIDVLPERPATADVVPWLARRLHLLVREAGRIREAARIGLAG